MQRREREQSGERSQCRGKKERKHLILLARVGTFHFLGHYRSIVGSLLAVPWTGERG
jgi:hypothetical protein